MPRGGARPGAGRPKGSRNALSMAARAEAQATGLLPHEFLLAVTRGEAVDGYKPTFEDRLEAAKAAAPFYAPKLASTQIQATVTRSHEDMLAELEADDAKASDGFTH